MNATRTKKVEPLDTAAPDPKSVEAIGRALEKHYASLIEALHDSEINGEIGWFFDRVWHLFFWQPP